MAEYRGASPTRRQPTCVSDLVAIIQEIKPQPRPLPLPTSLPDASTFRKYTESDFLHERLLLGLDCDEVYPGIFIGDEGAAKNKEYLRGIGITHVLNAAEGLHIGQVDTNATYYKGTPIVYLGLPLMDLPESQISTHFNEAASFIEGALQSRGKVLVHCVMGMSRSATIVIAYLMLRKGLNAEAAVRSIRMHRDVRPNDGFLQQLCELERQLHAQSPTHSSRL